METIIRVICIFLGLFVFANGFWVAWQPPYGDEPLGYSIMAVGIFIPLLVLYLSWSGGRPDD